MKSFPSGTHKYGHTPTKRVIDAIVTTQTLILQMSHELGMLSVEFVQSVTITMISRFNVLNVVLEGLIRVSNSIRVLEPVIRFLDFLQEEGRPHGICMQVWRYVLRDPPLQRQARLHVRLRCSWEVGDRRRQSRDCRRESRQNLRPTRATTTTSVIIGRDRTIPLLLSQE